MRFCSITTLCLFGVATVVALKHPVAGLGICLVIYLKPNPRSGGGRGHSATCPALADSHAPRCLLSGRISGEGQSTSLFMTAPPVRFHKSITMSRIGCEQHTRRLPSAGFSSGSGP
jgi:hypothetical protein